MEVVEVVHGRIIIEGFLTYYCYYKLNYSDLDKALHNHLENILKTLSSQQICLFRAFCEVKPTGWSNEDYKFHIKNYIDRLWQRNGASAQEIN